MLQKNTKPQGNPNNWKANLGVTPQGKNNGNGIQNGPNGHRNNNQNGGRNDNGGYALRITIINNGVMGVEITSNVIIIKDGGTSGPNAPVLIIWTPKWGNRTKLSPREQQQCPSDQSPEPVKPKPEPQYHNPGPVIHLIGPADEADVIIEGVQTTTLVPKSL